MTKTRNEMKNMFIRAFIFLYPTKPRHFLMMMNYIKLTNESSLYHISQIFSVNICQNLCEKMQSRGISS